MRFLYRFSGITVLAGLIFLTGSCRTAKDYLDPPDYRPQLSDAADEEEETSLPLPELALSGFVPLLTSSAEALPEPELPLPVFRDEGERADPAGEPAPVSPRSDDIAIGETARLAVPQDFHEPINPVEAEPEEKETVTVSSPAKAAPPAETPSEQSAPAFIMEETLPLGDIALLNLEGSDWYFLEEKEGGEVDFVDRTTLEGKSLFSFQFPRVGTYRLIFQRQNHSTGDLDKAEILVRILEEEDLSLSESPDGADPAEEHSSVITGEEPAGGDEPDAADAAERLEEIEEDPEKVEETLELLEYLVDVASDDESLAGYYYRMARTLEMNTRFQDLRRAYDTYEYIADTFFLTDYYELAEERIRYLDRHFFKLR